MGHGANAHYSNMAQARRKGTRGIFNRGLRFRPLPDQAQQRALHRLIARDDVGLSEHVVAAVEIGHEAARLAHDQQARRHVPGREVALPVGVEPAGGDPGEIERRGAEAAQPRDLLLDDGELRAKQRKVAAPEMRQAAANDGLGEPRARRDAQPLIVEEGALAALGDEELLVRRVVDDSGNDRSLAFERDRDRELRNAVQEVGRAVERVDDPAMRLVGALLTAAFLADEAVTGARLGKLAAENLLGAPIRRRDEIGGSLERDLQVLDLAEIPLEAARGLAGGSDHDVDESGMEHLRPVVARVLTRRGSPLTQPGGRAPSRQRAALDMCTWARRSIQGFAAFSAAARVSADCFCAKSSRNVSLAPPALEIRCHLIASTGSAAVPRPAASTRASRFCAIGLPRMAALRKSATASGSFFVTPVPLNKAIAYSTLASRRSASEAAAISRAASRSSFGTPRPSL